MSEALGKGDFDKFGFSLITIRNGNRAMADKYPKVYAEKLLYLKEGQYAPNHFHWYKTEDIINRGGGNCLIRVYNSLPDKEIEFLFGLSPQACAQHILDNYGVKLVFTTCGADGCYYATRSACGHVPSLNGIAVKDTTGAGDIFGGSALWKLLQTGQTPDSLTDEQLRAAVSFACTAASLSTTRSGGISSVPDYDEVVKALS